VRSESPPNRRLRVLHKNSPEAPGRTGVDTGKGFHKAPHQAGNSAGICFSLEKHFQGLLPSDRRFGHVIAVFR